MKKWTKIWLVMALIFGVAGVGLCVAAVSMGMTPHTLRQSIEEGNYTIWGKDLINFHEENITRYEAHLEADGSQSVALDQELDQLCIDLDYGKLTIKPSPEDRHEVYLDAGEDEKYFEWYADDYEIYIENNEGYGWSALKRASMPEATLYLPKDMYFLTVEVLVDAGECRIEVPMRTDHLMADVDAGGADIQNMYAETAELDVDAGGLTLSGEIPGGGLAEVDAGKMTLNLKGMSDTDYNYEIDVAAGALYVNDHRFSGMEKKRYVDNDGEAEWNLSCEAGKLEMKINP